MLKTINPNNVAVGGYCPGEPDNTTVFPQFLQVDYVRVYQRQQVINTSEASLNTSCTTLADDCCLSEWPGVLQ